MQMSYEVSEHAGYITVRGVSRREVEEGLELVRGVRAGHVKANRVDLVRSLMASKIPLMPPAALAQAQRLATHRDALLATPAYDHAQLRKLLGHQEASTTRAWLTRQRKHHRVFTVTHDGRTLIPAFQLGDDGQPRPELRPILEALSTGEVTGWALWTWLTTPTALLSGEIPERLARREPQRVLRAAGRFAAPSFA